jgi:hypothetical protein
MARNNGPDIERDDVVNDGGLGNARQDPREIDDRHMGAPGIPGGDDEGEDGDLTSDDPKR